MDKPVDKRKLMCKLNGCEWVQTGDGDETACSRCGITFEEYKPILDKMGEALQRYERSGLKGKFH